MFSRAPILSRRLLLTPLIAAVGLTSKSPSADTASNKMTSFKVDVAGAMVADE
jgi:hypothetical protein